MNKSVYIFLLFIGIVIFPQINYSQEDDLGINEDKFQEQFFEALKQKGIENYDRSIEALLKCIEIDSTLAVLYFELGKNYNKLNNYDAAEKALYKATRLSPENRWFVDELYNFYLSQNNLNKATETVKQLVNEYPDYQEDLASLYLKTKKYDEALQVLDQLDSKLGISATRDNLRNNIYKVSGRQKEQIENLETRVSSNPKNESNYLELIFHYSENNEKDKAFETAKELLKINPNSQLVQLALYKFYLADNNKEKAIESMKIIVKSSDIKPDAKRKVVTDFIQFVEKNPEFEPDLEQALTIASNTNDTKLLSKIASYQLAKNNKTKALEFFESVLELEPENFSVLQNVLSLYLDLKQYQIAKEKSTQTLEKYPSHPLFYLINAVALNELNQPEKAIESLETGLDYIIDDSKMEANFYTQLSKAYTILNNASKAQIFSDKAKQIETSN